MIAKLYAVAAWVYAWFGSFAFLGVLAFTAWAYLGGPSMK